MVTVDESRPERGWVRHASGSVWPAAYMHGVMNASAGFFLLVIAAGQDVDTIWMTPVGLTGMLIPLALVAVLAVWGLGREGHPAASVP